MILAGGVKWGEGSGEDPEALRHTESVGYTRAVSSEQCSALREYSEETEGSSARPPGPMEAEEVGTVEAQTVGIFRAIPRMKTDKRGLSPRWNGPWSSSYLGVQGGSLLVAAGH